MIPLRDVVVFPGMMLPFVIGRANSIRALEIALAKGKRLFLSAQHDAACDSPATHQIHTLGTICTIIQNLRLPDGNVKVLVEGIERGRAVEFKEDASGIRVMVKAVTHKGDAPEGTEALLSRVTELFEQYVRLSSSIHYDAMLAAIRQEDINRVADTIAANIVVSVEEKQNLLEIITPAERLARLKVLLEGEIEKLQVDKRIQGRVKKQMERAQKEYYLNEKMKAIQKELGRKDERAGELEELHKKITSARLSAEAMEKASQELKRLEAMPAMSAEATVSRNYLDWLIAVPWHRQSRERRDLVAAEQILNEDHYGLEKVKERIIEFLAVRQLVAKPKGPILCFVGPPGVGKTSLARSIARSTNRKFVRVSLGGVRDEA
ncbi:MAG: LON peptidase substrate-binding domain-containing protein, partial [Vicinamibacteria bacterium]|nr:LON peptidase substrate-binding domain-containing protein [Vicinamibacteria bacterium]